MIDKFLNLNSRNLSKLVSIKNNISKSIIYKDKLCTLSYKINR